MTNSQINRFQQFLNAYGAFSLFKSCVQEYGFQKIGYKEYVKSVQPLMAIRYAFPWDKSSTFNTEYWERINDLWENICIKKDYTSGLSTDGLKQSIRTLFSGRQILNNDDIVFEKQLNDKCMEDYTFYDFETRPQSARMSDNELSINHSEKNKSITFNIQVSDEIIQSGLMKLRVRKDNITGDLHLILNREHGSKITFTGKTRKNVTVINKALAEFLVKELQLDEKSIRDVINISKNISNSNEYRTYKIIRKPSVGK